MHLGMGRRAANNNRPWCGAWLLPSSARSTINRPPLCCASSPPPPPAPPRRHWGISRMPPPANDGSRPVGSQHARRRCSLCSHPPYIIVRGSLVACPANVAGARLPCLVLLFAATVSTPREASHCWCSPGIALRGLFHTTRHTEVTRIHAAWRTRLYSTVHTVGRRDRRT